MHQMFIFYKIEKKCGIVGMLDPCPVLVSFPIYDNISRYMRVARGTCSFVSIEFMGNVFTFL